MIRIARFALAVVVAVGASSAQSTSPPAAGTQGAGQGEPAKPETPAQRELPTVVAIRVEGRRRYTEQQLIEALGQKIGAKLDNDAIDAGLNTLWEVFRVRGQVRERKVEGGIELQLNVVEMPVDLEPRFAGNVEVDVETLRKWAQLGDRSELYLYQAPRVRERLLEGYHRQGYYWAEVDVVSKGGEDKPGQPTEFPDVIFEIREGPQVHVKDVVVTGNRSFPDKGAWFWRGGLQKLAGVQLDGPWLFNWKGERYVDDTLQADLLAMREVYRDEGYLDAVVELERREFSEDRADVVIHVIVDEGVPYRVSKLTIHAVEQKRDPKARDAEPVDEIVDLVFPEAELRAKCRLAPGKRYERVAQRADQRSLQDYYGERGYLAHPSLGETSWAFLDPELRFDAEKHEVEVTYRIRQGMKRVIREVLFQGAEHTRDRVLRREISVLPGKVADIKEITRSLSRLYSTSFFLDDFAPEDHKDPVFTFLSAEDPEHPELVDIRYEVEEGRVINFQIQAGVDSNVGLFGRISLRMDNFDTTNWPSSLWRAPSEIYHKEAFHGAGQLLDLRLEPGTEINGFRVHFLEPDVFGREFNPYSLDLDLHRTRQQLDFYQEDRLERRVRVGRDFGRNLTVFVGYANNDINVSNIEAPLRGIGQPDEPQIPQAVFDQEGVSKIIGGTFDIRYRSVDTTLNPREGMQVNWSNGAYGGFFGGDWDYVRSDVDFDAYWLAGNPEKDSRPGFHFGAGIGVANAYGDSDEVPYTERFFGGGSRLGRGFAYRGIGPNIGGVPIGGSTTLDGTIEYRIPLYSVVQPGSYREQEIFRMTFFTDAVLLDPNSFHLDFSEMRASVGVGFGLTHPIPLIFNFGFPIASGEGDRKQVFSFRLVNLTF
ncbi:MAG TPA: outer membrane protein assembly factor [Planctomycetota bacterium]|nr:outer membrane protein assembly factor [Planctomycetota bacterium]